jgi:hypothetical protein
MCATVLAFALVLTAGAAVALAEPVCENSWTGPAEGPWSTAEDWSKKHAPKSTEVACITSGKTVNVTSGTNEAGVLSSHGTLVLSGGTLELSSVLEGSTATTVQLKGTGKLTGAATLTVTGSLTAQEGKMAGTGATVIASGATAELGLSASNFSLESRQFRNEGTTTLSEGAIFQYEGAEIKNIGTFKANSQWPKAPSKSEKAQPRS